MYGHGTSFAIRALSLNVYHQLARLISRIPSCWWVNGSCASTEKIIFYLCLPWPNEALTMIVIPILHLNNMHIGGLSTKTLACRRKMTEYTASMCGCRPTLYIYWAFTCAVKCHCFLDVSISLKHKSSSRGCFAKIYIFTTGEPNLCVEIL